MILPIEWLKKDKGEVDMANCKCKEFLESVTFECDWKDLGLMGLCVGSLGSLAGMLIPEKYKNAAAFTAGISFFFSAVAVTVKSIKTAGEDEFDEYEDFEKWEEWDDDEEQGFVMKITAEEA